MLAQARRILSKLLQEASKGPQLSVPFSLAIQICSNIQTLSVILLPILIKSNDNTQDRLSWSLNKLFSYIQPLNVFNPLDHKSTAVPVITLCFLYFIVFFGVFIYTGHQIHTRSSLKPMLMKVIRFWPLFHNKVVFCLVHYFLVKIIDLNTACWNGSEAYYCKIEWLMMAIFLLMLNILLAFTKELFCFQIHQIRDTFGRKNNLYSIIVLLQKSLGILVFFLISGSTSALVLINLILTGLNLFVLHQRLPFYNTKILKMNIIMTTISFWAAVVGLARLWTEEKNLFIFLVLTMTLTMKASLIKLDMRFRAILSLKTQNVSVYEAVHLPVLVEEYLQNMSLFSVSDRINKATLYSIGLIASKMDQILELNDGKIEINRLTEEFRKQIYIVVVKEMLGVFQRKPRDELLAICIAQMYIQVFGDAFQTMSIINKLRGRKLNLATTLSLEAISRDLMMIHQNDSKAEVESSEDSAWHMVYFNYKHKTKTLKKYIKTEIDRHMKLWRAVEQNTIDILAVLKEAEIISSQSRIIAQYWRQNFEGSELKYVNASIIYGLYLEIVQALPSGGSSLIRKAFSSFNNKFHSQREIFDIILGNSAIVVASIEPDKLGKIIETSSSARSLFRTSKDGLIGSNVGIIMPNAIATKHNGFIKRYHKNSSRGFSKTINSFAKTLDDDYFGVEIRLQLSPFTYKGLNIVAHIKKISDFESILIVDEDGNIVEYSKNLALQLNLYVKRSHCTRLQNISPELGIANQALNLVYKPQEVHLITEKDYNGDLAVFEEEQQQQIMMNSAGRITTNKYLQSSENLLASPTSQNRPLMNSMENEQPGMRSSNRFERIMISDGNSLSPKINVVEEVDTIAMTREEAEKICKQFKEGKRVNFSPIPMNKRSINNIALNNAGENQNQQQQLTCITEIEPLIIESKLYKILKLKGLLPNKKASSYIEPPSTIFHCQAKESIAETNLEDDVFANEFPEEIERSDENSIQDQIVENENTTKKTHTKKTIQTQKEALSFDPSELNIVRGNSDLSEAAKTAKSRKAGTKAQSVIDSQTSQRVTARKLNNSLKIEKQSQSARLTIYMVYLAVLIIIGSIFVDMIYTRKSIRDLSGSMSLISLVNMRLGKTIVLWQALIILYARSVKLRPIDFRVPKYKAIALAATNDVLNNTVKLAEELGEFEDKDVVKRLYEKNIQLWEPIEQTLFNDGRMDSVTAGTALLYYSSRFSQYNGSYLDLNYSRPALLPLNNTANDYFLALEQTIDDLSVFFQETQANNVNLLKAIVTLEGLFLTLPLILIGSILSITVKLYSKLFKAICKIHNKNLLWRLTQLENISGLFNEEIEDDISYLSDFKWRDNTKNNTVTPTAAKGPSTVKRSSNKNRQFYRKGLIIYGLKYVVLAFIPLAILLVMVILSSRKSTQNLKDLDKINNRLRISYQLGSNIKMILPSFYFSIIFYNFTSIKIRNEDPETQLKKNLDALANANSLLLDYFTDANNEIDDPVAYDILQGDVCKYTTAPYYVNCTQNTVGGAYGLLGLQPLYLQDCGVLSSWFTSANPTMSSATGITTQFANVVNNLHLILYDVYDSLTNHLIGSFMKTAKEKEKNSESMFYVNLTVVLVTMVWIRVIVLTRLQRLDLGIRRILRIIPYKIIEENKVMSCYLAIAFQNELKVLKQIA